MRDDDNTAPFWDFDSKLKVEKYQGRKWRARALVGNPGVYKYQSMKTNDRNEAIKQARRWYIRLEVLVEQGQPLFNRTVENVAEEWATSFKQDVALGKESANMERVYGVQLKNHIKPYFKDVNIATVKTEHIEAFFNHKLSADKKPAKGTLTWHAITLKQVFTFAQKKGYIKTLPDIVVPETLAPSGRRSAFSKQEWDKIVAHFPVWINAAETEARKNSRIVVQHIVHILYETGMRPSDLPHLLWKDYQEYEHNGIIRCKFWCKGKTTGAGYVQPRWAIGEPDTIKWMTSWKKNAASHTLDDKLFPDKVYGRAISWWFSEFLNEINLDKDSNGNTRPPYSLRHTYATRMLEKGVSYNIIAENMGTSIDHIQNTYGHLDTTARTNQLSGTPAGLTPVSGGLGLLDPKIDTENVLVLKRRAKKP